MSVNDELLKAVYAADLSQSTKNNYRNSCNALSSKANGKSILHIISHPDIYIPLIHTWYPKATSFKVHLSIILGIFRYNPHLKSELPEEHALWNTAFLDANSEVTARYETNEPTERQLTGYVEYSKIIKSRDELAKGSIERVLLGMYTYIKPRRCEYARMAIYTTKLPADAVEPNYILLSTGHMVLTDFKTVKFHGSFDIKLPKGLLDDIKLSLKLKPRDWLFVNTAGEPYTHNMYTAWTLRVFKAIFNKPLSVSLIRHSFINTLNFNKLSIKERQNIATSMGHSIDVQAFYRLYFPDNNEKDGGMSKCGGTGAVEL